MRAVLIDLEDEVVKEMKLPEPASWVKIPVRPRWNLLKASEAWDPNESLISYKIHEYRLDLLESDARGYRVP